MDLQEVKRNLNKMIVYKGTADIYKLTACIIRKNEKGFYYQAEIIDTKCGHSLLYCPLEDITEVEKSE